ncbi:MAG: helix-turn-helix transcriptional regulator [Polyangiales bacterium]
MARANDDGSNADEEVLVRLRGEVLLWRGESQTEVAEKAGVHKGNLSRWLKSYIPKKDELLRLAEAVDVDPMALLDFRPWSMTTVGRRLAIQMLTRKNWLQIGRVVSVLPLVTRYLLGLDKTFPPDGLFDGRVPHPWHRFEYEHRARDHRNVWLRIKLTSTDPRLNHPQLWHFAWRDRFTEQGLDAQSRASQ